MKAEIRAEMEESGEIATIKAEARAQREAEMGVNIGAYCEAECCTELREEIKAEVAEIRAEQESYYAYTLAHLYYPDIVSGEIAIEQALRHIPDSLKDKFRSNIDEMLASSE
jgi:hypothetical protein